MDKLTPPQNMVLYEYVRDCWGFVELFFRDEDFFCLLTSSLVFSDLLLFAC